jgi:sodium/potassium/calcium exchanger 6
MVTQAMVVMVQVIVEKYRIPPDIAGVTFLSFGNGSPDVFSNIAAFSLSSPNIGVTSILGGGLLVTTGTLHFQRLVSSQWDLS